MLGTKLKKKRTPHRDGSESFEELRGYATKLIEGCVKDLVLAMRAAECAHVMTRTEMEDLVVSLLEKHEPKYYAMTDDDFRKYLAGIGDDDVH